MRKIKYAEMIARGIINKYDLSFLPVKLKTVTKKLNITIKYEKFDSFGAMITEINNRRLMIVNKNCPYPQRRFHIAHELGHLFLGHKGSFLRSVINQQCHNRTLQEKCADAFASELLIPSFKLRRLAYKNNFDVQKIKRIFCTSEYATAYKLYLLDLPYKNTQYSFTKKF